MSSMMIRSVRISRVVVEAGGDGVVAKAAEVVGEDAAHDRCGFVVDVEDAELEAVGGFPGMGVGSAIDDDIAVGGSSAFVAAFVDDLGVHGGADAGLDVLAFGFADAAEEAHQNGVGGVAGLVGAAEFGDPKLDAVGGHTGRGKRELVTEPASSALADDDSSPLTRRGLEGGQEPAGLGPAVPGDRS
jgi:hypothetical protein